MILERKQTLPAILLAVAALLAGSHAVVAADSAVATESLRGCLRLLHDGRFGEADARAAELVESNPKDPSAAFVRAFVAWWRLLYDDQGAAVSGLLEQRLIGAAARAEAAGPGRAAGVDHRVWNGYSRILLAELHASRKEVLAAIRDAKEGRRLLAAALLAEPDSPEPCFGLGTYNYYADRLPALAKGLRFLFGMPAGDRDTGLRQLRTAADRSPIFGLESRLLLATILASKHERDYLAARTEVDTAILESGGTVVVLDAAARLEIALGQPEIALGRLADAQRRAAEAPPADASVLAALRHQRARAEFSRFRPDLAWEELQPLLDPAASVPVRVRNDARSLADSCARLVGRVTPDRTPDGTSLPAGLWAALRDALELEASSRPDDSIARLAEIRRASPGAPAADLLYGRALLYAGRPKEALAPLERAAHSAELPEPWIGPARLLAGQAADAGGERKRALDFYRAATKSPPYVANAAAHLYLRVAYTTPLPTSAASAPGR